jgi:hypothetical protein
MIQFSAYIGVFVPFLICLVSNRQAIVDLINDGLEIEQEFRRSYNVKAWKPAKLLLIINTKDIISLIGRTFFSSTLNSKTAPISHFFAIPNSIIFSMVFCFAENLKIFSFFYLAQLLRTLNDRLELLKRIDRKSVFEVLLAFEEISKMYEKLLVFAERICKVLKYYTTALVIYALILTSAKVLSKNLDQTLSSI